MIQHFKDRTPWVAALVGLILGPVIGMLYLGKGRLSFFYLAIIIVGVILPFVLAHFDLINADPIAAVNVFALTLQVIGAAHCYWIAQKSASFEKWYSYGASLALFIIVPLMLAVLFRIFVYKPFSLQNASMRPNINQGDYIFAEKFSYKGNSPLRGDVVLINHDGISYIKRVAGIPADTIQMKNGILTINDMAVNIKSGEKTQELIEILPDGKQYKIIKESTDGPLNNSAVYILPENHYFVLGDNRDHSQDSRDETFGFIPQEHIVGRAAFIVWNSDTKKISFRRIE